MVVLQSRAAGAVRGTFGALRGGARGSALSQARVNIDRRGRSGFSWYSVGGREGGKAVQNIYTITSQSPGRTEEFTTKLTFQRLAREWPWPRAE